jgi:hypothetical protein
MKFSSHKLHKKIWYILAGEGVERDRQRDKTCRKEDARKVRILIWRKEEQPSWQLRMISAAWSSAFRVTIALCEVFTTNAGPLMGRLQIVSIVSPTLRFHRAND